MTVDHLVYGVTDLGSGVLYLGEKLGIVAAPGGKHAGRGTHNALLGLGGSSYLEVIALDPDDPHPTGTPLFDLGAARLPCLVGWAVAVNDIEGVAHRARESGYDPGRVEEMSRVRSDGTVLRWRLTPPPSHERVVPFLIDWGASAHPSATAPGGVRLEDLSALHPDPEAVRHDLAALGVDLKVERGAGPALVASLVSARGRLVLR
jgi:hypothetical protein